MELEVPGVPGTLPPWDRTIGLAEESLTLFEKAEVLRKDKVFDQADEIAEIAFDKLKSRYSSDSVFKFPTDLSIAYRTFQKTHR